MTKLLTKLFVKDRENVENPAVRRAYGTLSSITGILVNLLLWPVLMIIYASVAFALLPWQWALLVVALLLPAPIVAHESYRLIRIMISDTKLLLNKELRGKYAQIRDIIFEK